MRDGVPAAAAHHAQRACQPLAAQYQSVRTRAARCQAAQVLEG